MGRNSDDAYFLSAVNNASTLPPLILVIAQMLQLKHFLFPVLLWCLLSFRRTGWIAKWSTQSSKTISEGDSEVKVKISYYIIHYRGPTCSHLGLCLLSYSLCISFSYTLPPFRPDLPRSPITNFNMPIYKYCIDYSFILISRILNTLRKSVCIHIPEQMAGLTPWTMCNTYMTKNTQQSNPWPNAIIFLQEAYLWPFYITTSFLFFVCFPLFLVFTFEITSGYFSIVFKVLGFIIQFRILNKSKTRPHGHIIVTK